MGERSRAAGPPKAGAKAAGAPRPPRVPPQAAAASPSRAKQAEIEKQAQENVPPGEQLFFSRKPREVDYTPASVDEFKQKYVNKEYSELGKLGPDLDDDELLMKRAIQEKKKQFSKELQKINRQRAEAASRNPK